MNSRRVKQHNRNNVEEEAVKWVNYIFARSGRVFADLKTRDKVAHIDGYLSVIENNGDSIGTLEVQVKGKSAITAATHSFTKPFLEYCLNQTISPVILLLVDISNKKAYWMHMNKVVCQKTLNYIIIHNQKSRALTFNTDNYLCDNFTNHCIDEFTKIINAHKIKINNYDSQVQRKEQLEKEVVELNKNKNIAIGETNLIYKEIHVFLDFYNNLLDNDFYALKENIYPDYWKIGVGFYNYLDTTINFVLYPISFELNDVQIKQFKHIENSTQNYDGLMKQFINPAENPIKAYPKQYAYELIQQDLISRVSGKLSVRLLLKDFFLATEYLFDFINNCYTTLNLMYGQETYLLTTIEETLINIENNIIKSLPSNILFNKSNFHISASPLKSFNLGVAKQLIQYLQSINIKDINRDNYFSLLGAAATDIIIIRKKFYNHIPKIYNLLVKTHFPNLINDLKFFKNYDLLVIVFDFSDETRSDGGMGRELHYELKSISTTVNKVIFYSSMKDLPSPFNDHKLIEIENEQYQLQRRRTLQINQFENKPIITYAHDLLKSRLNSYFKLKTNPHKSRR